jgi:uncharacterized membrane protein
MNAALESTDLTKLGIGIIIGLVVIGFVLSMLITAIVARVIIAALVVGAGILVWQQRTSIKDDIDNCHLSRSFFGITVNAPDSVVRRCHRLHKG